MNTFFKPVQKSITALNDKIVSLDIKNWIGRNVTFIKEIVKNNSALTIGILAIAVIAKLAFVIFKKMKENKTLKLDIARNNLDIITKTNENESLQVELQANAINQSHLKTELHKATKTLKKNRANMTAWAEEAVAKNKYLISELEKSEKMNAQLNKEIAVLKTKLENIPAETVTKPEQPKNESLHK